MDNKKEKPEQPMEILEKLREALKPIGYEIYGFEYPVKDYITLKIGEPMRYDR